MKNPTQSECREDFRTVMADLIKRLDQIDGETPATPYTEPKWWIEMMNLRDYVRGVLEKVPGGEA